jgi:hypothetical protein
LLPQAIAGTPVTDHPCVSTENVRGCLHDEHFIKQNFADAIFTATRFEATTGAYLLADRGEPLFPQDIVYMANLFKKGEWPATFVKTC